MLRTLVAVGVLALPGVALADPAGMRVLPVNDHLLAFYDGRPPEPTKPNKESNWADFGAMNVGVATYVVHRGTDALVYDAFPSLAQARWVRHYLRAHGIRHLTLVNSHWHLDHVGGNAAYADVDRIATEGTFRQLAARKVAIEAGTEWGPPAIRPLVLPNILVHTDTTVYVGDVAVELRPVNIHSADGLVLVLPADRILLPGDTLEDTLTFVTEPEGIPVHVQNLRAMKRWPIERIYPNHGNPAVIATGGYATTLIDATVDYLSRLVERAHDPDFLTGSLERYVGDSISRGWVSPWWAYREAHTQNLTRVAEAYRDRVLPDLREAGQPQGSP